MPSFYYSHVRIGSSSLLLPSPYHFALPNLSSFPPSRRRSRRSPPKPLPRPQFLLLTSRFRSPAAGSSSSSAMVEEVEKSVNPADSDGFVIRSGVRSGLKREFAFALRAQAELVTSTLSRTRSGSRRSPSAPSLPKKPRRSDLAVELPAPIKSGDESLAGTVRDAPLIQVEVLVYKNYPDPQPKPKSSDSLPPAAPTCQTETPVSDGHSTEDKTDSGDARTTPKKKMELKMSKKIALTKLPANPRELLASGLLDGAGVKYVLYKNKPDGGIRGLIKGSGILCYCKSCNGSNVVTAYQFEQHAGSTKKYPWDYIFLDNGSTLRGAFEACNAASLDMLESAVQNAIASVPSKKPLACQNAVGLTPPKKPLACQEEIGLMHPKKPLAFQTEIVPTPPKKSLASQSEIHPIPSKEPSASQSVVGPTPPEKSLASESGVGPTPPKKPLASESTVGSTPSEESLASQGAVGPTPLKKPLACQKCKGPLHASWIEKSRSICDSCFEADTLVTTTTPLHDTENDNRLASPISARDFTEGTSKSASSHKKTSGKLTKKGVGKHKSIFSQDILRADTQVGYYVRGQKLLDGWIKDSGILCNCCKTVVSASQFEAHAGQAKRRKPYNHIYTEHGVSLHELFVSLRKDRLISTGESDDLCNICEDGGDLLLCDLCPRAFHKECVGLSIIPEGDWYCQFCTNMLQREKCVGHNSNALAAGRVAGVDPMENVYKRCIRTVTIQENNVGGCVFCRRHDFTLGFGQRTVLICDQCEREYHVGCMKEHNMADLKEVPKGEWFCSTDCGMIYTALQESVLHGSQQLPCLCLDIIKRKRLEKGLDTDVNFDVRWRILKVKSSSGAEVDPEIKLLFSEAISTFHKKTVDYTSSKRVAILARYSIVYVTALQESFDPIVDATSKRDLIPYMVYGDNTQDQDFSGMYCIVLTVNSSVVSAGILRILGCEAAELPLVATNRDCQGLGYFQILFSCIERLLASLKVKHFVLPAAEEAESIWTNKFGFARITSDQLHEYTKGVRTMVFQGTSLLHKLVPNHVSLDGNAQLQKLEEEQSTF